VYASSLNITIDMDYNTACRLNWSTAIGRCKQMPFEQKSNSLYTGRLSHGRNRNRRI